MNQYRLSNLEIRSIGKHFNIDFNYVIEALKHIKTRRFQINVATNFSFSKPVNDNNMNIKLS